MPLSTVKKVGRFAIMKRSTDGHYKVYDDDKDEFISEHETLGAAVSAVMRASKHG